MPVSRNSKIFRTLSDELYGIMFTHETFGQFYLSRVVDATGIRPKDLGEVEDGVIELMANIPRAMSCMSAENRTIIVPGNIIQNCIVLIVEGTDAIELNKES